MNLVSNRRRSKCSFANLQVLVKHAGAERNTPAKVVDPGDGGVEVILLAGAQAHEFRWSDTDRFAKFELENSTCSLLACVALCPRSLYV